MKKSVGWKELLIEMPVPPQSIRVKGGRVTVDGTLVLRFSTRVGIARTNGSRKPKNDKPRR